MGRFLCVFNQAGLLFNNVNGGGYLADGVLSNSGHQVLIIENKLLYALPYHHGSLNILIFQHFERMCNKTLNTFPFINKLELNINFVPFLFDLYLVHYHI